MIIPALAGLALPGGAHVNLLSVVAPQHGTPLPVSGLTEVAPGDGGPETDPMARPAIGFVPKDPAWIETREQAMERVIAEARMLLTDAARPLQDTGIAVISEVIVSAHEADAIIGIAARDAVDLIAMALPVRGRINEAQKDSVPAAVLKAAVAPVLLVQPAV